MTYARLCEHGRFEPHDEMGRVRAEGWGSCPGGSVLPEDSLVIVKKDGEWPEWLEDALWQALGFDCQIALDALANAQGSTGVMYLSESMDGPMCDRCGHLLNADGVCLLEHGPRTFCEHGWDGGMGYYRYHPVLGPRCHGPIDVDAQGSQE